MPALATFDFDDETAPEPWPDGPIKRVDEAFRKVCLDSTALQPLMHTQPDLCIEILLTVLIEEPTPRRRRGYDDSSFELERLNFESTYDFYPPLWFRGPFLSFFQINPSCAIKFLCKLVDFATDRTFDYRLEDGEQPFSISIPFNDGVKEYLGGPNIFLWFRDQSHVPDVVVSALMAFEKWLYLMIDLKEDVSVYLKEALTQTKSVAIVGVALEVGKKSPELFTGVLRPFLASEYFYDWDTQRLASLEGFQMMGWGLESEQFAKLAKGFHGLPHRKYELSGIAIQFFLNDESMVSCFNEAREEWQRKLKKNPDNLSLENLCLWFDGKNWHEVETPNGEKALEFRAPKSVEEKRKEGLEESQKRLLISTTPLKLHKLIEERRELSDSEAEQLWHSVTYFENILTDADAEGLKSKYDIMCGIAAILIVCASNWVKKRPEVYSWCQKTMAAPCKNPSPPKKFDVPSAVLLAGWDEFCPIAYPFLWEHDVHSKDHREIIALLASTYYDKPVGLLCTSVKERASALGDSFIQFVNLVIQLGAWRCGSISFEPSGSLLDYKSSVIRDFVDGKTPCQLIDPLELEKRSREMHRAEGRRVDSHFPWLDLSTLKFALSCLVLDFQGKPPFDFDSALNALESGLTISLRRLDFGTKGDDERPRRTIPLDFDHWILREVASAVPHIPVSKGRDNLWKVILSLGPNEERFVQDFLLYWFATNLEKTTRGAVFTEIWRAMIDYALSCESWDLSKPFAWYNAPVLFGHLIGGTPHLRNVWGKEYGPLIETMRPSINRVLEHCARSVALDVFLARLLAQPAFSGVLDIGLRHIRQSLEKDPYQFWRKHGLAELLAEMLESLYSKQLFIIRQSEGTFDNYRWLLTKLAERHNLVAQELLARLSTH